MRFDRDLVSHPHTPLNPVKLDRKRCFMRIERMKVDGILTGTPTGEKNPCLKRCGDKYPFFSPVTSAFLP